MRKTYPTDLSDEEWACLKTHCPDSKPPGRLRAHSLRDIFDAIFYVLRSGCPWRMLPGDLLPWSTVYYHFRRFRLSGLWQRVFAILRAAERKRVGKDPNPSAAIMDSRSINTTERGAESNGYDAHKNFTSRAASGICWSTLWAYRSRSTSPLPTYRTGPGRASCSLGWTAGASPEEDLGGRRIQWQGTRQVVPGAGRELEVVERDKGVSGFRVLPKRWIVERTFEWLRRDRRLSKDYERKVQTSETFIEVAMIRLMLRRLARIA